MLGRQDVLGVGAFLSSLASFLADDVVALCAFLPEEWCGTTKRCVMPMPKSRMRRSGLKEVYERHPGCTAVTRFLMLGWAFRLLTSRGFPMTTFFHVVASLDSCMTRRGDDLNDEATRHTAMLAIMYHHTRRDDIGGDSTNQSFNAFCVDIATHDIDDVDAYTMLRTALANDGVPMCSPLGMECTMVLVCAALHMETLDMEWKDIIDEVITARRLLSTGIVYGHMPKTHTAVRATQQWGHPDICSFLGINESGLWRPCTSWHFPECKPAHKAFPPPEHAESIASVEHGISSALSPGISIYVRCEPTCFPWMVEHVGRANPQWSGQIKGFEELFVGRDRHASTMFDVNDASDWPATMVLMDGYLERNGMAFIDIEYEFYDCRDYVGPARLTE